MNRKLKLAIRSKFLTQEDFAKEVGENPSFVSLVINGRRPLSDERKTIWGNVLGVEASELFQ